MPSWISIEEMIAQLQLTSPGGDVESIRAELKREIAALHPDRNGGIFESDAAKDRYHALSEGLSFVEHQSSSTAVIPIRDIPSIVAAMNQALQPAAAQEPAVQARAEYRQLALGQSHSRYTVPRISSGVFSAACAALLAFSGALKENPLFGPLVDDPIFNLYLFSLFIFVGFLFIKTWWNEQRDAEQIDWLATESGLRHVMSNVVRRARDRNENYVRFNFRDVCNALSGRSIRRISDGTMLFAVFGFTNSDLSPSSIERLAKLHLDELERRGVIRKLDAKRLYITYECDRAIAEDLLDNRGD